ncbi:hypothetical protein [Streptomyces sp. A0592]|uniref:hypothetical protein n=1 Tax=Streptomyces sp. A0592 TaxID=2563099 RepID=UPI00109EDAFF|nr:hypothetical protein [Streptomyces sp. A0592]THA79941.1 hypothetical protein E6U81_31135 [Streptomyces sp. A0592]
MAKIAFTLAWGVVLVLANRALHDVTWAQYVATFLLAGACALALSKARFLRGGKAADTGR